MLMEYFDTFATNHQPYKGGPWCYEDGLVYRGLELLFKSTAEPRWLAHIHRLIAPQILEGPKLLGYDPDDYNIDNILPGRALLFLYQTTGEATYLQAANLLNQQLETHPRTKSNIYWHKGRYPWQVWLDGLYMGAPFQIEYGLVTGRDALVQDALDQVSAAMELTFVPQTGLYAHAYDEARKQPWCDPETGHTKAHWARAVGWLALALVDIAALTSARQFAPLQPRATALFDEIARWRQPDGLWLQVMDQPQLAGNWTETSASAMFCYALLRARELGIWHGETDGLLAQVVKSALRPKAGGGYEMIRMCHVAGLGMYEGRFRDGTAEYYISEDRVSDDTKGVGPLMMAVAASLAGADKAPALQRHGLL
ncbi:unsaturated rhamnogalacturonyl hydrolase [Primorskyibacter sedentarius]|uniref:Unsaturated rhamnogalacturonyl hydrolase n=1 Tax=Primorskyibacter sedentarius TaxID=745311 RepID=A0A4R3JA60_9RHOB|nr:glycoside hydrolase family 88 protein [Primorskyibacter sedentarius]TCS62778.1 unsaturated rhamnogalacturonyl hydrolase [Primorskyibacter sedentarius]